MRMSMGMTMSCTLPSCHAHWRQSVWQHSDHPLHEACLQHVCSIACHHTDYRQTYSPRSVIDCIYGRTYFIWHVSPRCIMHCMYKELAEISSLPTYLTHEKSKSKYVSKMLRDAPSRMLCQGCSEIHQSPKSLTNLFFFITLLTTD
ncbi:hypothetical protein GGR50DRAFT_14170 [Xylaria sp. CBS 124048]|nr:hypothetical protein GGR50DRAFT_14170 [Xylaria sp. CBS 124048]